MTKSFVSMEQKQCIVCGEIYDSGSLLLNRRMTPNMEQHTLTGLGACPEHQKLADDGYIALIGVNESTKNSTLKPSEADRTGELVFLKKEAFEKMFTTKLDPGKFPMVYVSPELINELKLLATKAEGALQ